MSDTTIEVRIQTPDTTRAVPFGRWPLTRIDDLLPMIERIGVNGVDLQGGDDPAVGHFVVTASGTYFEVVVGDV